jgi:ferredoxin-NADP reductase
VTDFSLMTGEAETVVTSWQRAEVREVTKMSPRLVSLRLSLADRVNHLPGQHYVVRLTAEDGYTASRSYSVASAPSDPLIELCIERLDDGEVSGYLYDVVEVGDEIEVRGPIGGWFVWDATSPAAGIAGGSGVVPLVAMARHAVELGRANLLGLAVSGRSRVELPYLDELDALGATVALTGSDHRLGAAEIAPLLQPAETAFICGSARFAEAMSQIVVDLKFPPSNVRVERFGPTG